MSCCCMSTIGVVALTSLILKFVVSFFKLLQAYLFGTGVDLKSTGEWAVVTGATDGIGKSYAFELAKRGMKVCLISRNQEKLTTVSNEILQKYPKSTTKTIAIDFTGDFQIYDEIEKELNSFDVGVLINNVGMSVQFPDYFVNEKDVKLFRNIITCNTQSVMNMTYMFLKKMMEKKKGVIVNVSSASGVSPMPLMSVYSASKAFVDFFSRTLQIEINDGNCKGRVFVQSVLPFFVSTKMSGIKRSSLIVPSAETYAISSLNTIGLQERSFGFWTHSIQGFFIEILPGFLIEKISLWKMKSVRKASLKKLERSQKKE